MVSPSKTGANGKKPKISTKSCRIRTRFTKTNKQTNKKNTGFLEDFRKCSPNVSTADWQRYLWENVKDYVSILTSKHSYDLSWHTSHYIHFILWNYLMAKCTETLLEQSFPFFIFKSTHPVLILSEEKVFHKANSY